MHHTAEFWKHNSFHKLLDNIAYALNLYIDIYVFA